MDTYLSNGEEALLALASSNPRTQTGHCVASQSMQAPMESIPLVGELAEHDVECL